MREQMEFLKNHRNPAANSGKRGLPDNIAAHQDFTLFIGFKAIYAAKNSRFAASGRANNTDHFTLRDRQTYVAQYRLIPEGFPQIPDLNHAIPVF
jgi:hypothetical protein